MPEAYRYVPAKLLGLQVVLKTVERCNLRCPYCYFFETDDQSWRMHDPMMHRSTARDIAEFLKRGIEEMPNIKNIYIDFHGGEPTMQKKVDFDWMCALFSDYLGGQVGLQFRMQSNAALIDEEWIELFLRHDVACSVSLDGPRDINDKLRPDPKGRGSYDDTVRGLRLLQQAALTRGGHMPGVLCVIDPKQDARRTHRHFVDQLGIDSLNYLLPERIRGRVDQSEIEALGKYLVDLFDAWTEDDNPSVQVRIHADLLGRFLGRDSMLFPDRTAALKTLVFAISSSGHVTPDDALRPSLYWRTDQEPTVRDISLRQFLESSLMHTLNGELASLPTGCEGCTWSNICGGGYLLQRYDPKNGFDNPSVWCSSLAQYYEHVFAYLVRSGAPLDRLRAVVTESVSTMIS